MITVAEIEKVRIKKFSISTSLLIRAALNKGLNCEFLPEKVIKISSANDSYLFKGTSLPSNSAVAAKLSCNKYFLRRLLNNENLPTPRTVTLSKPSAWSTVLKSSLQFPLVVKPIKASHANGATLNITSAKELEEAVSRAFTYMREHKKGNRVLVEEYFSGRDLRLLVVGNQVVSVLEREPAHVIGNGHSTIHELINIFSNKWRSPIKYDLPLCPIPIDNEVMRYLSKNNLNLNSVLPKGKKSYLRWNGNVSTGGRPSDVTDLVHPSLKQLAVQIAKLSHLDIGGVDILCKDFTSADVTSDNISILEINDSPGFDIHHYPVAGASRNITSDILDYIFGTQNQTEKLSSTQVKTLLKDLKVTTPVSATQL